jgi:integrase
MARDPLADVGTLYRARRAEVVWEPWEVEAVVAQASAEAGVALRFVWLSGLRRGDACAVRWDQWDHALRALVVPTGKSGGRTRQVVPVGPDLEALMAGLPRRAVTILTSSRGAPWRPDSLTHALLRAVAKVRERHPGFAAGKTLHDLRGTRATEEVAAMLADPALRERMGWTNGASSAPGRYVAPVTVLAARRRRNTEGT